MRRAWIFALIFLMLCSVAHASSAPSFEGKTLVRVKDALKTASKSAFTDLIGFKPGQIVEADALDEALYMLSTGEADVLFTYNPVGRFVSGFDDALAVAPLKNAEITLRLMTTAKKTEFMENVNFVIKELKTEKTNEKLDVRLYELVKQHITGLTPGQLPQNKRVFAMPDAGKLKVGISGVAPPIDYVDADGVPRGFDDAFMIMLAGAQNLNITYVSVPFAERYTALKSGKVDVFYFEPVMKGYADVTASGFILSSSFITTTAALVYKK